MEEILLDSGTIINFNGIPFVLRDNTVVLGSESNYRLALENNYIDNSEDFKVKQIDFEVGDDKNV